MLRNRKHDEGNKENLIKVPAYTLNLKNPGKQSTLIFHAVFYTFLEGKGQIGA